MTFILTFQTSLWLWKESKTTKTGLNGAHLSQLSGKSERLHLHCWLHTFHGSKTPFPCPPPRKQQHIHLLSMVLRKRKKKGEFHTISCNNFVTYTAWDSLAPRQFVLEDFFLEENKRKKDEYMWKSTSVSSNKIWISTSTIYNTQSLAKSKSFNTH